MRRCLYGPRRTKPFVVCEQQKRRLACASAQSDQRPLLFAEWKVKLKKLATRKITMLYLGFVAEQTGTQVPKTGFLSSRPIYTEGL